MKTSAINTQELEGQFDLCRNELIRVMNNFSTAIKSFENENNVTISDSCFPGNDSNNPFNPNCSMGTDFSNFGSYCTMFFNKYKEAVKAEMGEIAEETDNEVQQ
jgi:hypothetical protein